MLNATDDTNAINPDQNPILQIIPFINAVLSIYEGFRTGFPFSSFARRALQGFPCIHNVSGAQDATLPFLQNPDSLALDEPCARLRSTLKL
jgi:hypothetical protein